MAIKKILKILNAIGFKSGSSVLLVQGQEQKQKQLPLILLLSYDAAASGFLDCKMMI